MRTFEVIHKNYKVIRYLNRLCDLCKKSIPDNQSRYEVVGKIKRHHAIAKWRSPATDYDAIVVYRYVCSEECAMMTILQEMK